MALFRARSLSVAKGRRAQVLWPLSAVLIGAFVLHAAGQGPNPRGIPYRGHLERGGVPISDTVDMTFTLFDDAVAGSELHSETLAVDVAQGAFAVVLGREGPALDDGVYAAAELFVEVAVQGAPLAGRQQIWAMSQAQRADSASRSVGDFTVGGALHVADGRISSGPNPPTTGTDLGLYSSIPQHWMRFVTNDAPFRFYSDADVAPAGGDAVFTVDPDGSLHTSGQIFQTTINDASGDALNASLGNPLIAEANMWVMVYLQPLSDGARGWCRAFVDPGYNSGWVTVGAGAVHEYAATDNHIRFDSFSFPVARGDAWFVDCFDTAQTSNYVVQTRTIMP